MIRVVPVLVSSTDGVGTKLKVAVMMGRHNTVGADLVNHCVNDIAVQGATPLFFMDYLATGSLDPEIAEKIVEGMADACRHNGCALIGGETAEMPGFYPKGEYDLAGFIVGVVEKSKIITGDNVEVGDVLVGLPSNGLHTNGYSLARKLFFDVAKYMPDTYVNEMKAKAGTELMHTHKSYWPVLKKLIAAELVHAMAAQKYGYPLSLWTYDESLRSKLNSVLYLSSHEGTQAAPAEITFEYSDRDLSVRKTFHFDHTYVLKLETAVTYKGSPVAALPAWPSGFGDQNTPASYAAALIDYQFNNNIERLPIKKISSGATINGPLHWAGPLNQYFAAIFIPDDPSSAALVTLRNPIDNPQDAKHPNEVVGAAVGNLHGPTVERVFVGPKALDVLESVQIPGITGTNPDLRGLVDFGWWGILARPLFLWLKWTYNHLVHNW